MTDSAETVLLHLGLHKTGSTAIQKALQEAGRRSPVKRVEDMNTQILLRALAQRLVVSSESLLGTMRSLYSEAPQRLERLRSFGLRLHLIVFVRAPLDWHESMYIQRIQEGESLAPEKYAREVAQLPHLRISGLLERLIELEPEHQVSILPYSGDVVGDFARVSGIELKSGARSNSSLAPARAALASRINGSPSFASSRALREVLQRRVPALDTEGSLDVFSEEDQQLLQPAIEDWRSSVVPLIASRMTGIEAQATQDVEKRAVQVVADEHVLSEAVFIIAFLIAELQMDRTKGLGALLERLLGSKGYDRWLSNPLAILRIRHARLRHLIRSRWNKD